jgi:hypothetical protein
LLILACTHLTPPSLDTHTHVYVLCGVCVFRFKREKHVCFDWRKDGRYALDPRFSPQLDRKSPTVLRERSNTLN